ncbi:MAG: two-component system sensor histidine kinase NtrB, partial [Desulfobacteria bacterium]
MSEAGKPAVEPRERDIPIVRVIGIIGWVMTALIAVAIPAIYYIFSIRAERESLQIETAYTARAIRSIIFARPEMWEFETLRIMEIASARTVRGAEDERTIYDTSGNIVVETKYKAPAESITSTAPIFVSGNKAGSVQAKRSVRNILWGTVFAGILGSAFGLGIYLFFRSYPRRLLNEALTRLSAEKEKTETTLSSIGDGVMTVDREGRIAYMNPVAEMCTGWRSDEASGRDFKDCYVTRGESGRMESKVPALCTLLSRNGEQRTIEEVWSPIKGENSVEDGHVIVFRDVTEKLSMERQVQQAQKMESLGVMAGGIAHDFNNLLTIVLGHAELALNEISPMSPARGSLTEITTAARRAADLSLQMLAYTGKAVFAAERVALGDLVEEMAHLIKTAISKKATLTLNLEKGLPPIQGDPSQIRQIVMNLIINASEAIGDRSGVITVSVGAIQCGEEYLKESELQDSLPPGLYVRLEVTDTGIGMDAGTRSRIFEPFFSTKFTGRGLGLAA